MPVETIPLAEFLERLKAQEVPRRHLALVCPVCGTVQSMQSLIVAGAGHTEADVEKYLGFSCVGRWINAGPYRAGEKPGLGCDWTLGGLLQLHRLEVVGEDGTHHMRFEVASRADAHALMATWSRAEQTVEAGVAASVAEVAEGS